MSNRIPWYLYQSDVVKSLKKWIKLSQTSQRNKETLFQSYNCILPIHSKYNIYWQSLVDVEVTEALEKDGYLNWFGSSPTFQQMHAVMIPNHRSSFCHSISVALWGFPDFKEHVTNLLNRSMKSHPQVWMKRFGKEIKHTNITDKNVCPEHIFIMANLIQRPIIIVSNEDSLKQTGDQVEARTFFGIYLPLLSKPISCSKIPIFLAYFKGVFFPLLVDFAIDELVDSFENTHSITFPLTTNNLITFPVNFLPPQDEIRVWEILQDYLIVKEVPTTISGNDVNVLSLQSTFKTFPEDKNIIFSFVQSCLENKEKPMSPSRFNFKAYRKLLTKSADKSTMITPLNMVHHQELELEADGPEIISNSSAQVIDQIPLRETNVNLHTGSIIGTAEINDIEPSAPGLEMEEPLSMLNERCIACNGYRSSVKTFPYCHECFNQRNVQTPSLFVQTKPVILQYSNERLSNYVPCTDVLRRQHELKVNDEISTQAHSTMSEHLKCKIVGSKHKRLNSSSSDENNEPLPAIQKHSPRVISDIVFGKPKFVSEGTRPKKMNDMEPSAPDLEMEEPLSMLNERCIACNGYRSSIKTFPYCHECFNQQNVQTSPLFVQTKPVILQHSNERLSNYMPCTDVLLKQHELKGIDEISTQAHSAMSEHLKGRIIGSKYKRLNSSSSDENNEPLPALQNHSPLVISDNRYGKHEFVSEGTSPNELIKCASPVCEKELKFPQQLCEKCATILQAHNSPSCNKSCCQGVSSIRYEELFMQNNNTKHNYNSINPKIEYSLLSKKQPVIVQQPENSILKPDRRQIDLDIKNMALSNTVSCHNQDYEESDLFSRNGPKDYVRFDMKSPDAKNSNDYFSASPDHHTFHVVAEEKTSKTPWNSFKNDNNKEFDHIFTQFENSLKNKAKKCKSCKNFGTEEKDGFCNHCFTKLQMKIV